MAARRVLIVKGSPRKNGNTAILADLVAEGARAGGAHVDTIYLQGMNIQPCDACDACKSSTDQGCIVQDDMQQVYPKIREADAIVLASPVYWFSYSAQTKLFIDRGFYPTVGQDGQGMAHKRLALLMTYEDADPFVSGAINALRAFQDMCKYMGAEIAGMVYSQAFDAGEIRSHPSVMESARQLGEKLAAPA
jgi:multimeric flavodoxin WrbA